MRPGLNEVRDRQFGVFTRWQALCEYTRREFDELTGRGAWIRVFHGVYREAASPPTTRLRLEAARLSLGVPSLPACYGTAAELHGFAPGPDDITHVLGRHHSRPGRLMVHRDRTGSTDLESIGGTLTTTAARTAVDIARTADRTTALLTVEAALRAGLSPAALRAELRRQHRRRGARWAAELLEYAIAQSEPHHGPRTRPRAAANFGR